MAECRALYHEKWKGEPAWIEIFVDNLLEGQPTWLLFVPLFRDIVFSEVLFHELGHHIHKTLAPSHTEREDLAEKWKRRLEHHYYRRTYWYLAPLAVLLFFVTKLPSCFLNRKPKRAARQ